MGAAGHSSRHRVAIVVLAKTLVLDLAVAVQSFGHRPSAFQRIRDEPESPYDVVVCGRAPSDRTTLGFTMGALGPDELIATADTVVVTGLDLPGVGVGEDGVLEAIAAAKANGARLVSLCAGAFVLARAGVLAGHRVTTHWALADELRALCPDTTVDEAELYIDDGQVLSSGGMLAGADLCLHILRTDLGQAYANDMARLLVSPPHRSGSQLQYARRPAAANTGSLAELTQWMLAHLRDDLSVERVAARANLSVRTLSRRWTAEHGESLAAWVSARRIEMAREMLEISERTVTEVAYASGFGSLAAFRRQFLAATGVTPSEYRSTFHDRP